jgi:hypothetical protein
MNEINNTDEEDCVENVKGGPNLNKDSPGISE